jgi:hypothetical protein
MADALIVYQLPMRPIKSFEILVYIGILIMNSHKSEAIPLQALTGPDGSRSLRLPNFKTIGTRRW